MADLFAQYSFSVMVDFVMAPFNFMVAMETGKKIMLPWKIFFGNIEFLIIHLSSFPKPFSNCFYPKKNT